MSGFTVTELTILIWLVCTIIMVVYAASRGNDRSAWIWVLGDACALTALVFLWFRPSMPLPLSVAGTNLFSILQPLLQVTAVRLLIGERVDLRPGIAVVLVATFANVLLAMTATDVAWRGIVNSAAVLIAGLPAFAMIRRGPIATAAPIALFVTGTGLIGVVAAYRILTFLLIPGSVTEISSASQSGSIFVVAIVALMVNMSFLWLAVAHQAAVHSAEQRRIAADLAVAHAEAEAALHAKTVFVASMRHAFRTPLNAVIGFNGLLAMDADGRLTPRQRDWVGHVDRGAREVLGIVDDVLDLAGFDPRAIRAGIRRVDLALLLETSVGASLSRAKAAGVTLSATVEAAGALAEPQRLAQGVSILVENALSLCRPGDVIHLRAAAAGPGRVRIAVCDSGAGIAPHRRARLFEPFLHVAGDASDPHGSGLGLALACRIVEAMSGTIGFASWTGEGSTFWIDLPAQMEDEAPCRPAPVPAGAEVDAIRRGLVAAFSPTPPPSPPDRQAASA